MHGGKGTYLEIYKGVIKDLNGFRAFVLGWPSYIGILKYFERMIYPGRPQLAELQSLDKAIGAIASILLPLFSDSIISILRFSRLLVVGLPRLFLLF